MTFRYRYVDFGTNFSLGDGPRYGVEQDPSQLGTNELAVDVGGACWGWNGEQRPVLDHHFYRATGQFPAASAAVLHNAERIRERFLPLVEHGDVWLVTHKHSDFDAFCAMYLARAVLSELASADGWQALGLEPDGWTPGPQTVNWFDPELRAVPEQHRWTVLLAAYAARVDNSRRLACPKNRSLHSVLYAGVERGRDYASTGAWEFFEEVRKALSDPDTRLSPLYDSVLEGHPKFAPELALLDRELEAYDRDIARARRAVVFVPQAKEAFQAWYQPLADKPLLSNSGLAPDAGHLDPPYQSVFQTDGLYLRDPECLLFKEWARIDADNSSMGQGFLFTAIAHSRGRPGARHNETEYFFSLDPEQAVARRLHLYPVWARLQAAEIQALHRAAFAGLRQELEGREREASRSAGDGYGTICRQGFEGRAGAYRAYFNDPWYDGVNYECTIVATPERGTVIGGPGTRSDLSDDAVAHVVEQQLEWGVFTSGVTLLDCPGSADLPPTPQHTVEPVTTGADQVHPPQAGCYRFGHVSLRDSVNLLQGRAAEQIGRVLWRRLDAEPGFAVPPDLPEHCLVRSADFAGVWNRHGVMIAHKARAAGHKDRLLTLFQDLVDVARSVQTLARTDPTQGSEDQVLKQGDELVRRVARNRHQLALPENRLLGYFFDASRLDQVLTMLRDVNQAAAELSLSAKATELAQQQALVAGQVQANVETLTTVQGMVEWIEVILVSVYLAHLWHMFANDLFPRLIADEHVAHWVVSGGVLVTAVAGALSTALWLKPWTHQVVHSQKKEGWHGERQGTAECG